MKARDVMTADPVSVGPETSTREIARLLLDRGISAVPVVDESGAPIGMVSEGDLIGRAETERQARKDWWLQVLAEGETLNPQFVESLRQPLKRARDVMSGPVVTAGEDAEIREIAQVLTANRIKRVPIIRDGHLVGIVSCADLLRALSEVPPAAPAASRSGFLAEALGHLDDRFLHKVRSAAVTEPGMRGDESPVNALLARDFQRLVANFEEKEVRHREEARRAAAEQHRHRVAALINEHISDEGWRNLLHKARTVAENGRKEYMLLRFPSQLCDDRGRAINAAEPNWPATLRGEAAELYVRWERDLKPRGFHLVARVLDFPGGMPGDIGLHLVWGQ